MRRKQTCAVKHQRKRVTRAQLFVTGCQSGAARGNKTDCLLCALLPVTPDEGRGFRS